MEKFTIEKTTVFAKPRKLTAKWTIDFVKKPSGEWHNDEQNPELVYLDIIFNSWYLRHGDDIMTWLNEIGGYREYTMWGARLFMQKKYRVFFKLKWGI